MRKICFITGTRADYGILSPIMRLVAESKDAELQVIATNMHLSDKYGMTVRDIERDGFQVDVKIDSLKGLDDSPTSIVKSMARVQEGLAEAFPILKPDLVVILGDRYEALAAASAAVTFGIPVTHLHGGEITGGALDDYYRNAITQLSTFHFASTPQYAARIISMGIEPNHVFHSGAPGAERVPSSECQLPSLFEKKTEFKDSESFFILAIHPVTKQEDRGYHDVEQTIIALQTFIGKGYKVLVTMPNSDSGNEDIALALRNFEQNNPESVKCVASLGSPLFRYALSKCQAIIGNSSAALIEAPSFHKPSVNIGKRQLGRASGPSIIHVDGNSEKISKAIERAVSDKFIRMLSEMSLTEINPYYKEDANKFIANTLINCKL